MSETMKVSGNGLEEYEAANPIISVDEIEIEGDYQCNNCKQPFKEPLKASAHDLAAIVADELKSQSKKKKKS